jgi:hypothetical protein
MSEGGEARNHEAEVEVVARALWEMNGSTPWAHASQGTKALRRKAARAAIAALDAVKRSSRPIGPGNPPAWMFDALRRSPQGEDHEAAFKFQLPSPSMEDHEAGIEAGARAMNPAYDAATHDATRANWRANFERGLAAYLSRCPSPERDTEKEN